MRLILAAVAAGATHTDSTDEAALQSHTFPAYWWQPGKVLHFEGAAVVADTNSTDTLTLYSRIGATGLGDTAIFTSGAVDVADGDVALVRGTITCRSVGTAGVLVASVEGSSPDAAGIATGAHVTVLTGVNTEAATTLVFSGDWSVAHADNQVACQLWNLYEAV